MLPEQLYLNKLSHMELEDWAATLEEKWDGNMHILHPQALPDLGATLAPGQAQLPAQARLRRSMSCLAGHRSYYELQAYLRQGLYMLRVHLTSAGLSAIWTGTALASACRQAQGVTIACREYFRCRSRVQIC